MQFRATIGPPEKRHLNGVSLVGRKWFAFKCKLGKSHTLPQLCIYFEYTYDVSLVGRKWFAFKAAYSVTMNIFRKFLFSF